MEGTISIMNSSGDDTLTWSDSKTDGKLDPEFVKAEFDRLVSQGHLAYNTNVETGVSEKIKTFDPQVHTKVTISPQYVGG